MIARTFCTTLWRIHLYHWLQFVSPSVVHCVRPAQEHSSEDTYYGCLWCLCQACVSSAFSGGRTWVLSIPLLTSPRRPSLNVVSWPTETTWPDWGRRPALTSLPELSCYLHCIRYYIPYCIPCFILSDSLFKWFCCCVNHNVTSCFMP